MDKPIRQIFLSYSRPDQDQAEQIARRLDQQGHRVWYGQAKIVPGDSWSDALDRGVRESSHCLVIVGPGDVRPGPFLEQQTEEAAFCQPQQEQRG